MMSQSDFDNLSSLAKDRHAEMLAQAQRQQMLNQARPARTHGHSVWQWLQEVIAGHVRHANTLGTPGPRHSIQHH